MKKVLAVAVFLLLLVAAVVIALSSRQRQSPSWFSAVANGNGYDALVEAATSMKGRISEDKTEAAQFVQANEAMFRSVEAALKLPFELPAKMYSISNSPMSDLGTFKSIALALRARGREAEQRGEFAEAATNYASIIQLGQRVEHGPIVALLVGIAIEKIGLDGLFRIADEFKPRERTALAAKILAYDRARLPFSEVLLREEYFAQQVAGNPLKLLFARFYLRSSLIKAEQKQKNLSLDFQAAKKLESSAAE